MCQQYLTPHLILYTGMQQVSIQEARATLPQSPQPEAKQRWHALQQCLGHSGCMLSPEHCQSYGGQMIANVPGVITAPVVWRRHQDVSLVPCVPIAQLHQDSSGEFWLLGEQGLHPSIVCELGCASYVVLVVHQSRVLRQVSPCPVLRPVGS